MTQSGGAVGSEPPFLSPVAIVGVGAIGGSVALAVKRRWPSARVIAIDRQPVVDAAIQLGAADDGGETLRAAGGAALVVLAAPVRANIAVLRELPDLFTGSAIVTDVGSTKSETVAAAAYLPRRLVFIGGHPLAGAAAGGLSQARADLFDGSPWVLTPEPPLAPDAIALVRRFVEGLGAQPVEILAAEHDRLVAYLSHLPQLAVTALMHVVGEAVGDDRLALAGRGLRDTTRLASSPAAIWRDIAATNPMCVTAALNALIETLQTLRSEINHPEAAFNEIFASAARWKERLDRR